MKLFMIFVVVGFCFVGCAHLGHKKAPLMVVTEKPEPPILIELGDIIANATESEFSKDETLQCFSFKNETRENATIYVQEYILEYNLENLSASEPNAAKMMDINKTIARDDLENLSSEKSNSMQISRIIYKLQKYNAERDITLYYNTQGKEAGRKVKTSVNLDFIDGDLTKKDETLVFSPKKIGDYAIKIFNIFTNSQTNQTEKLIDEENHTWAKSRCYTFELSTIRQVKKQ